MVSRPISVLDCDIPVQGAGAFIITTAERAKDLAKPAAHVHGIAEGPPHERSLLTEQSLDEQIENGRAMSAALWTDSGLGPTDIDVADLYDGFSIMTPLWLEYLGFCREGEAFDFMQDGRIAQDGVLPVNPSGGNLGGGRLHGVNHLMDAMLQVTGRSGQRQVEGAELAVVAISPPLWASGLLVLGKNPA